MVQMLGLMAKNPKTRIGILLNHFGEIVNVFIDFILRGNYGEIGEKNEIVKIPHNVFQRI